MIGEGRPLLRENLADTDPFPCKRPIALQAYYVTVVSILSAEYRLPLLSKTDPPCSAVSLR